MSKKQKKKIKIKYKKKIKYVFSYAKYFFITLAWIMIWRWAWNLLDKYFIKEEYVLSNILSVLIWIFLLSFLSLFEDKKSKIKI